jgi:hypothetical protein
MVDVDGAEPQESVREQAVKTALAFLLAESVRRHAVERRRRDRALMMRLRDSLTYRVEALAWHAHLLRTLKSSAERRLAEVFPDKEKEYHILMRAGTEQHYAFDDLVFNALAAFDYLGNFVGFAYYGEQRKKAKWDRIQKYARDGEFEGREHSPRRISGCRAGESVRLVHSLLVDGLSQYRHALIHYEALRGRGTLKTTFESRTPPGITHSLFFEPPSQFWKYLPHARSGSNPSLQDAAGWVVSECETSIRKILRELERDLRLEANLDPDGTDGVIEMV